jgi:protein involved in sex pheromone biosynthesis
MDFSRLLDGVYIICLGLNLSSLYRKTKSSDTYISKIIEERSVREENNENSKTKFAKFFV